MSVIESKGQSLFSPSSSLLEMHLAELEEECARFLSLVSALRAITESTVVVNEDERDTLEADIYVSLSHMNNHVRPAMEEMNRLLDEMADDEENDETE